MTRAHSIVQPMGRLVAVMLGAAVLTANAFAAEPADTVWPPALRGMVPEAAGAAAAEQPSVFPRIIGGVPASESWPSHVALLRAGVTGNYAAQFCGGNLIAARWVVTAAHCIENSDTDEVMIPDAVQVLAGTTSLAQGGRRVRVIEVIRYPGFDSTTFDGDLALLRLAEELPEAPSRLIDADTEPALAAAGVTATVIGWGNTTTEGSNYPTELMQAQVPIVSNEVCNSATSYNGSITANMLCAGFAEGGVDSCQGDSGGPLFVPSGDGGYVQAGVVSFGNSCARPNFYGVYTRLAQPEFGAWIAAYLAQDGNPNLAPLVDAGEARTVQSGTAVTVSMSARDSDGVPVEARVEQIEGPTVAATVSRVFSEGALSGVVLDFVAPAVTAATPLRFRFTATDDDGAASTDEVEIVVEPRATTPTPASGGGSGGGGGSIAWLGVLAALARFAAWRRAAAMTCRRPRQ